MHISNFKVQFVASFIHIRYVYSIKFDQNHHFEDFDVSSLAFIRNCKKALQLLFVISFLLLIFEVFSCVPCNDKQCLHMHITLCILKQNFSDNTKKHKTNGVNLCRQ
jgi:hypothetical protein